MNEREFNKIFEKYFGNHCLTNEVAGAMWKDIETAIKLAPNNNPNPKQKILDSPIEDLLCGTRILNVLHNMNVEKVCQLVLFSEKELLRNKNFGKKSLREVVSALYMQGLRLEMDLSKYRAPYEVCMEKDGSYFWPSIKRSQDA